MHGYNCSTENTATTAMLLSLHSKKLISWSELPYPHSQNLCYNNNPAPMIAYSTSTYIQDSSTRKPLPSCKQLLEFFFSWLPTNAALREDLQEVLLAIQCWSCSKISAKLEGHCIRIRSRKISSHCWNNFICPWRERCSEGDRQSSDWVYKW